ncbi:acetyltransferase [Salinibacter sp.]|uniref:acetyltransferase n=1 Tax=Salinibacter sp. TaxID=2065818 RepID=UPI0021E737F2|nr:acetyltransferase [Salinibacter sp.]
MPDPTPLLLVGAGGFGREVAALVETLNQQALTWNLHGFVDDDPALRDATVMEIPVRGDVDWLTRQTDFSVSLTIGDGSARRAVADRLTATDLQPATLVHPTVSVHRTVHLGPGTILCQGAAPTVDVQIGPHAVLDQHCTVGHDAVLDAFVSLRPGARISGSAHLEQAVTVGAGAVVLPDVTIGAGTTVGAGAVVTEDLPPDCTAVGRPARPQ